MLEILMALTTLTTAPAYATDSLYAFGAFANDRVVDGIPYADGNGVVSAGAVYAHPSGFFFGTELLSLYGHGRTLPDERTLVLDSFVGWQIGMRDQHVAVELLDYRLNGEKHDILGHPGFALSYRSRQIKAEYAYEFDKPYYAAYSGTFHRYNAQRAALAWRQPVGDQASWTIAAGGQQLDWQGVRHEYLSASMQWRWQEFDWHIAVIRSSGDFQRLAGDETSTRVVVRVARSFKLL